ncbi:hypothetical protein Tco_0882054 [Tanacetum coccineum]
MVIDSPCFCNKELTTPEQTATGKEISNPFIVDSLLKTIRRGRAACESGWKRGVVGVGLDVWGYFMGGKNELTGYIALVIGNKALMDLEIKKAYIQSFRTVSEKSMSSSNAKVQMIRRRYIIKAFKDFSRYEHVKTRSSAVDITKKRSQDSQSYHKSTSSEVPQKLQRAEDASSTS